ncbi:MULTISPECIES: hypothetical protein [unclassified Lysobacter]|uniref:hypothetical protein n=1 Tax=unclassified Lysobacter TaxID=2635362 RepID=UPI001BEB3CA6|nr:MULTISPECIES: hypothetical protein [unclassified Lysobacter]MBT2744867.1 hypothetical protein [Lysobacter sp. ISL-42]MBT2752140.1 hypothetical protein [Lysobacter sp. ISL-50]MBT2778637.1 hypothetical protein [Lysobacter sp. ISL-54]MBT2780432.1 hypothetical protein [Lysobacter sp. ISL-52]
MSEEVLSPVCRIFRIFSDRPAQASDSASETSENEVGLSLFNPVGESELHKALAAPGAVVDNESMRLVGLRCWGDELPQRPARIPRMSLLAAQQWPHYGKGKRAIADVASTSASHGSARGPRSAAVLIATLRAGRE